MQRWEIYLELVWKEIKRKKLEYFSMRSMRKKFGFNEGIGRLIVRALILSGAVERRSKGVYWVKNRRITVEKMKRELTKDLNRVGSKKKRRCLK